MENKISTEKNSDIPVDCTEKYFYPLIPDTWTDEDLENFIDECNKKIFSKNN